MMLSRCTKLLMAIFPALAIVVCFACSEKKASNPGDTVLKLLDLHNLAGRQLEERTKESSGAEVDRAKLAALIVDLDEHDPFIADIYLGFVLGVLASNQARLFITVEGSGAKVAAGKAVVKMRLVDGNWKIVLGESVPQVIKERAFLEKKNYEEAKARARAASASQ
jgi:hypothetical protein